MDNQRANELKNLSVILFVVLVVLCSFATGSAVPFILAMILVGFLGLLFTSKVKPSKRKSTSSVDADFDDDGGD